MILFVVAGCTAPIVVEEKAEEPVKEVVPDEGTAVQEKVVEEPAEEPVEEPVEAPVVEPEPTIIVKTGEEPQGEVPPAPIPSQKAAPSGELDEEIAFILSRADEKITSYKFTYAAPPQNLARDVWYIKGTRIKVELFNENWIRHDEYFDTIYIDTAKKTAVAYCQRPKTPQCAGPDVEFPVDYEEVMIMTPYQWIKTIPQQVEKVSTEMLWDRKVTVLRYMEGGAEFKQWVDNFAGLPLKVQKKEPGKDLVEWGFRYLSVNSLGDEDLEKNRILQSD